MPCPFRNFRKGNGRIRRRHGKWLRSWCSGNSWKRLSYKYRLPSLRRRRCTLFQVRRMPSSSISSAWSTSWTLLPRNRRYRHLRSPSSVRSAIPTSLLSGNGRSRSTAKRKGRVGSTLPSSGPRQEEIRELSASTASRRTSRRHSRPNILIGKYPRIGLILSNVTLVCYYVKEVLTRLASQITVYL